MIWTARNRIWAAFGLALLAYSSTLGFKAQAQKAVGQAANTSRLPARTTILTRASARPLFKQCSRPSPAAASFWTPTAADVQAAEKALRLFAGTFKTGHGPGMWQDVAGKRLRGDYRQYAGFVDKRSKHKCLYLNGFPARVGDEMTRDTMPGKKPFDWKREPVVVCDGGDGFWGAEYDTQTGRWLHFSTNGR